MAGLAIDLFSFVAVCGLLTGVWVLTSGSSHDLNRVAADPSHCSDPVRGKQVQSSIRCHAETGDRAASGIGRVREAFVASERQPAGRLLFGWARRANDCEI